jgi:hypothetical protein
MKYFSISTLLGALAVSLTACDRNVESGKQVTIESGQFVATEPSAVRGALSKSEKCSIDTVNGRPRTPKVGWEIKRGEPIDLQGWIFSNDGKKVAPEVFVQLSGPVDTYYAVTNNRIMRADANQHLAIDSSLTGGFRLQAKSDAIEPGVYEINIVQSFPDAKETCEDGVTLTVN